MNYDLVDCEQRSPEWFMERCGRLTGSRAPDMMAKIKTGEAAGRRNLRAQLTVERLTGVPQESADDWMSREMKRGMEVELRAIGAYEAQTGLLAIRPGFVRAHELAVGFSPDGLVDGGVLELKCPMSATHLTYLRERRLPPAYVWQCTHALWVLDTAPWIDFVSYDERMPERLRLFRVRVERVELAAELLNYDVAARAFLAEVDHEVEELSRWSP